MAAFNAIFLTNTVTRHYGSDLLTTRPGSAAGISLRDALGKVPIRAPDGVRYPFTELLHIIVCAVVTGARTLTMITEWAQHAAATSQGLQEGGCIRTP